MSWNLDCIWTLLFTYIKLTICTMNPSLHKIWLALNFLVFNYCLHRRVSTLNYLCKVVLYALNIPFSYQQTLFTLNNIFKNFQLVIRVDWSCSFQLCQCPTTVHTDLAECCMFQKEIKNWQHAALYNLTFILNYIHTILCIRWLI